MRRRGNRDRSLRVARSPTVATGDNGPTTRTVFANVYKLERPLSPLFKSRSGSG